VPDADDSARALDGIRRHLPALVALAGNSPLRRGRDTGFASSHLVLLSTPPRTGIPPAIHFYAACVRVVAALCALARRPPAAAIRWDASLQPSTGTLEVRMLDAQTRVHDAAALAALVQCLVRMHADPLSPVAPAGSPRMLEDNCLLATRDGTDAMLAVDRAGTRRHVRVMLEHLVDASLPAAGELGCLTELIDVTRLITAPGAQRQRALFAARRGGRRSANLRALVAGLHDQFTSTNAHRPDQRLAA
jgi:carboxylate-amine ligase